MVFWVFLTNLKLPIMLASILGLLLCGVIAIWSARVRASTKDGTVSNTDAQWRQVFCLKVALGIVVGFIIIQAIPNPDFNVRYVDRPTYVEKKVEVVKYATPQQTYIDIYAQCINNAADHSASYLALCHSQAMAVITPPQTIKVVYKNSPYKELFNNCNDNHNGGIQALTDKESVGPRNERIQVCAKLALEGSTIH